MADDPIIFDASMEQRLLNAHQDWLASRQAYMLQWSQAQDVALTLLGLCVTVLALYVLTLDRRIDHLEGMVLHVNH
jgi:hypothetical protein